MAIVRWDPLRDLADMQNTWNRWFDQFYGRGQDDVMRRGAWVPPVDIFSTGNHELVLCAELPDMKREDIELTVDNNVLTLRGERKLSEDVKEENFHRIERAYGPFSRSFALPLTVDTSKVKAEYKNGVLTVRLPMREEAKPRQIEVQTAA
jgi:HSP20 family protein